MTWLGDTTNKIGDVQKTALEAKRTKLVDDLKKLKAKGPAGTHPHHARHFQEDMIAIASEIKKLNKKMGLPLDSLN